LHPPKVFVPQVGTAAVAGSGGDTTTVGQGICGTSNGCVAVYTANQEDSDGGTDTGTNLTH
jgi:hypothetical protein